MAREASPSNEQAFFDSSRAFLSTASTATSWRRLRLRFFVLCRVDGLSLFSLVVAVCRWRDGPVDGALLLLNLSVLSSGAAPATSRRRREDAIDATF